MSNTSSINEIKEIHDELYTKVLQSEDRKKYLPEVDALILKIISSSSLVDSFEDYRWLSDTAIKWQSVFSTLFANPRLITLSMPKNAWLPPALTIFSEEEISNWIKINAAFIGLARRTEGRMHDYDELANWHTAEVAFASEVLKGNFKLGNRISSKSYWRLENIWLKEVKCLMAYFIWLERKGETFTDQDNYYEACNRIRNELVKTKDKGRSSDFDNIRIYIQDYYLGEDKKHLQTMRGGELNRLIERKAYQIYETTGSTDNKRNFIHAETYVKMFYENIIPAVIENDKERILRVLKAFQYSKLNRFIIINCFEAAIAINFLNSSIIKSLWEESTRNTEQDPESTVESIVEVDSWPMQLKIPESCKERFWYEDNRIGYKGVMMEVERNELLDALDQAESEQIKEWHKNMLTELYEKSRHIHKETTL